MKRKILKRILISSIIATCIITCLIADALLKQGSGVKKISNNKYTFGNIGNNMGHRLYNHQDSSIITRDNQSVKDAYGNGSIEVTYNEMDVCGADTFQTVKGPAGPLSPIAANIADWDNPKFKWDDGVTVLLNRAPGYRGAGKYSFHYDEITNPNLTKSDGGVINFNYDTDLSGVYNTPDGFTIYENGEEITSKVYDIGTGNGRDGEVVTDILDAQGNPTGLLTVKGKNWCRKNNKILWRWADTSSGETTDPANGVIEEGTVISGNSDIYGPNAENGFSLYFDGKEITSHVEEAVNEECYLKESDDQIIYSKNRNWCDKEGNEYLYDTYTYTNYGKKDGFIIRDAYGNDICAKEMKQYATKRNESHNPLTPVISDLSAWASVIVPKNQVYIDPIHGRIKFSADEENDDYIATNKVEAYKVTDSDGDNSSHTIIDPVGSSIPWDWFDLCVENPYNYTSYDYDIQDTELTYLSTVTGDSEEWTKRYFYTNFNEPPGLGEGIPSTYTREDCFFHFRQRFYAERDVILTNISLQIKYIDPSISRVMQLIIRDDNDNFIASSSSDDQNFPFNNEPLLRSGISYYFFDFYVNNDIIDSLGGMNYTILGGFYCKVVGEEWQEAGLKKITDVTYTSKWQNPGFNNPCGITYHGNFIYFADMQNHRIIKLNGNGNIAGWFGKESGGSIGWHSSGTPVKGSGDGELDEPYDIEIKDGYMYIVDSGNLRVQKINLATGAYIAELSGIPSTFSPRNIAIYDGYAYVNYLGSGSSKIIKFNLNNNFGFIEKEWDVNQSQGIAVDDKGFVYVTDILYDNIKKYNSRGQYVLTIGKSGRKEGEFTGIKGVTIDNNNGFILAADSGNRRIQIFNLNGAYLGWWGRDAVERIVNDDKAPVDNTGGSMDEDLNWTDIIVLEPSGGASGENIQDAQWYGARSGVEPYFSFSSGLGEGELKHPYQIAVDDDYNIYIVERNSTYKGVLKLYMDVDYLDSMTGDFISYAGEYLDEKTIADVEGSFKDLYFKLDAYEAKSRRLTVSKALAEVFLVNNIGNCAGIDVNIADYAGNGHFQVTLGELTESADNGGLMNYKYLDSTVVKVEAPGLKNIKFDNFPYLSKDKEYCLVFQSMDYSTSIGGSPGRAYINFEYADSGNGYGYMRNPDNNWAGIAGKLKMTVYTVPGLPESDIPKEPIRISYNYKPIQEVVAMDFDTDDINGIDNNEMSILMAQAQNKALIDPENNMIFINKSILSSQSGLEIVPVEGFSSPNSVSVNPTDGTCWVADTDNNKVRKISADGTTILAELSGFYSPESVSVNQNDGTCWVADTLNNQVKKINAECTRIIAVSVPNDFNNPSSVSVNPNDGTCWVADMGNNLVKKVRSDGAEVMVLLAAGAGNLNLPVSVSVNSADGTCWVADNNTVKKILADGTIILPGLSGFSSPKAVSVNQNDGTCWVADTLALNNKVKKINAECTMIIAESDEFNNPSSVSVNQNDGTCWVADTDRIKKISADGTAILTDLNGFNSPLSISINSKSGECWAADTGQDKIVKIYDFNDLYTPVSKIGDMTFDYNYKKYSGIIAGDLGDDRDEWRDGPPGEGEIYIDPVTARFRFHNNNLPERRLSVSYNFIADSQDLRSFVYGELAIDPGNGRILFHSEDVPFYPINATMGGLYYYQEYEGDKPMQPIVLNAVESTSDTPFVLKGSKEADTSIWLESAGNKTEIVNQDPGTSWAYPLYLENGENILNFSSKRYELESDVSSYAISYSIKNPTIDNESPVFSPSIILKGKKGKGSLVGLVKHIDNIDNQQAGDGNDTLLFTFSLFSDSVYQGEIVKDNGDEIERSQQGLDDAVSDNAIVINVNINGNNNNIFDPQEYTPAYSAVLMDLSDETGSANWTDPDVPEQGEAAIDLKTGRFKFSSQDIPPGNLTVEFNHFNTIAGLSDTLTWSYDWYSEYGDLTSGDNIFIIRSTDRMGNQSEVVNKTIVYSMDLIGADQIDYEYIADDPDSIMNDLSVSWTSDTAVDFKLTVTEAGMNTDPTDFDQVNYSGGPYIFKNVADSPFLTFHIMKNPDGDWTHKHIKSKQLTSLVPFVDEFSSIDSLLRQGTYTKIYDSASTPQGWNTDSPGELKSRVGEIDKLIIPQKFPTWQDYQFTVYIRKVNETALNFSLLYKVTDLNNYYEFKLNQSGPGTVHEKVTGGSATPIPNTDVPISSISEFWDKFDDFIPVKIEVRHHKLSGTTYVKAFIDNIQVNYFIYNMPLYGGVGIKAYNTEIAVDKLEIRPLR